jgi:hypothetical protein
VRRRFRKLERGNVTALRERDDDRFTRRLDVILAERVAKAAGIDADDGI